jgi:paraquat-inducible protein B
MAEPGDDSELPQATVVRKKRGRVSIVWIIPILAALVGIGIVVQRIRSEGPTITIVFRTAEGIEAGKTFIKYKDVNIGQVKTVQLTEDYYNTEITAKISKRAAGLMMDDAKFWIVRPTISLSGVAGLNTLLSGNYIGFESGKSDVPRTEFIGLDKAPVVTSQFGREFVLKAENLGSLTPGSPIYYRKVPAGQVTSYSLAPDGKSVEVRLFVNAPYDKFVTPSTRFWNASGFDVIMDTNGLDLRTESLVALLIGGLAFDTPPYVSDTASAPPEATFTLFSDRATAMKLPNEKARRYVLHFDESLRNLSVGAPVTFLGLPAGEVTDVGLELDAAKGNVRPRVTIAFYPERLVAYADKGRKDQIGQLLDNDPKRRDAFLQRLFDERGLRAQLKSGSLLTGQMYVALEYFPKAGKAPIDWRRDTPELPVVGSSLAELEAKLTSILDKVDKVPLEALGASLKKDLESLDETLGSANKLIKRVDTELVPTLKTDLEALHRTLGSVERTLDNASATLVGPNAPAQQELRDALTEFTRAARSMRQLLDYLERHPESPIRGKVEITSGGK